MNPNPAHIRAAWPTPADGRRSLPAPPDPAQLETELRHLRHELEVRQHELEQQNQELREAKNEIEYGLERYTELFHQAPAGYFNLTTDGTIRLANLTCARLLGRERPQELFGGLHARTRTTPWKTQHQEQSPGSDRSKEALI